ncbi:polysaccharide lyase family 8, super-sandwich domain protein [Catonella morbi ATCC 51271]|uniref:Polysaccharide lyase family 8, super-sandwich domain protein n=1 Tax=Catonella morbi ATCC 51271 TaxID=592026 RepID=V2Y3B3_9FIRM|nr:polysaccharide lyase 8 family protein [Catonella morbi]ESL02557.1 polysaccharide lyase family 8, super-sandwich domain protein [Catonella morbi ATCC 51271]
MKLRRITKTVSLMMTAILCTQMIIPKTPLIAKASLVEEAAKLDSSSTAESEITNIDVVRGNTAVIQTPEGFAEPITWTTLFKNADGNPIKNVGSKKKKDELKEGDVDGDRTEGIAKTDHIAKIEKTAEGGLLTAYEKGMVYAKAVDKDGKTKEWKVNVLYTAKENLPTVSSEDYKRLIGKWTAQLVGENPDKSDAAIMETINSLNAQAQAVWDKYSYKGQPACTDVPWPEEIGKKGNKAIEFTRDAVEFRQTFKNVLLMAKAYRLEHGALYKNPELLKDMINILEWLTANCYRPQSQTDNWWTWEIGIPKDIIPTLILLSDKLTPEQKIKFTEGVRFFQPDPFHGGAIGTGSTHVLGYRMQYAANRVDNSMTALGLGLLLEDNEFVHLASLASSSVLEFVSVADSTTLAEKGYPNGYYKDGSYIDHSRTPYAGSYGIVVLEGIVNISAILSNSPWQFSPEKAKILEDIFVNTYGLGVYNGLMLDTLRGRAVSREKVTDKSIGRQVMTYIIKSLDSVSEAGRQTLLSYLKNWLTAEPEFIGTLKELNEIVVKQKAQEIIGNAGISGVVPSVHKNYPLMDRAIHRADNWLFALSMFSERILNTEIMNGENLYGWHQGDGMTYLYGKDTAYYNDNYWNTINPFRLPGTTTVSKNIGNGDKDSSNFYQEGDYTSKEAWVGGSELKGYGVNGMSLSGDCGTKTIYAPNLRALKSYFMFDNEVVCLGSGINDSESNFITETTVENRKLNADASNQITLNGNNLELQTVPVNVAEIVNSEGLGGGTGSMEGSAVNNAKWIHVEGNVTGEAVGYYFPKESGQLKARKVASTGNWGNINITSSTDVVKNYFELWFDHGKNPQNAEYSYVMLPGKTVEEMKEYEKNPTVEILANTTDVQAVRYKSKNVIGANFWQDKTVSVSGITCNKKASVIVKQTGDNLEIGVSDPTMKNTETIEVEIDKEFGKLVSADTNVAVSEKNGKIHLVVNTKGTNGDTSVAEVKLKTATPPSYPSNPVAPAPGVQIPEDKTPEGQAKEQNNTEKNSNEAKKTDSIKKIKLNFNIKKDELKKGLATLSKILVKKSVLKEAAKKSTDVILSVRDENKKVLYSWSFTGKDLQKSKSKFNDINLSLKVVSSSKVKALKSLLKGKNGTLVSFAYKGKLPTAATIKIYDAKRFNYPKNKKLYVYYYNEKKNRLEETNYDGGKILKKGVLEFKIAHGSDYVVLPEKLDKN